MNALITVVGNDRVGIIAAICVKLAEYNVNVLDLSQTILHNNFTMIMAVDLAKASGKRSLTQCIRSDSYDLRRN